MTKSIQPKPIEHDLWSDLDQQFEQLRSQFFGPSGLSVFGPLVPIGSSDERRMFRTARADVTDTGTSYRIVAEVPGIPKEKLEVHVRGSVVEIRGESSTETDASVGELVQHERRYAGYYRALELPEPVVATEAKAKVANGLLELELPKQHPHPGAESVQVKVE